MIRLITVEPNDWEDYEGIMQLLMANDINFHVEESLVEFEPDELFVHVHDESGFNSLESLLKPYKCVISWDIGLRTII